MPATSWSGFVMTKSPSSPCSANFESARSSLVVDLPSFCRSFFSSRLVVGAWVLFGPCLTLRESDRLTPTEYDCFVGYSGLEGGGLVGDMER